MTTPSKAWIRRRSPSITWKCTRTVSPALNFGIESRSWARSSCSMILLIRRSPPGPGRNGSKGRARGFRARRQVRWVSLKTTGGAAQPRRPPTSEHQSSSRTPTTRAPKARPEPERSEARDKSAEADALRRPVDREHLADDVLARHGAPDARIAGRRAVVAHHEVVARVDLDRVVVHEVPPLGL